MAKATRGVGPGLAPPSSSRPTLNLRLVLSILAACVLSGSEAFMSWVPPPDMCESTHRPAPFDPSDPSPRMPRLPKQYSMKVEANIIQKRWTTEVEEHYDSVNQRASVAITFNGSTTVSIFNFESAERYDIYPNGSCQAGPATVDFFGFVKQPKGQRPMMATVNDVFRYGTKYNETYVGKDIVRGIPVNHWTSCQEWKRWGARFQLDFYFADPDFVAASGGEQIPVRAVLNGSAGNVGMQGQSVQGRHNFQHFYEFMSVRPGAPVNEEVFQVPPGTVCKGRQDTKKLPELPDQFEMNMEIVVPDKMMPPKLNYMLYDWPHQLLETGVRMVVKQKSRPYRRRRRYRGGSGSGGPGSRWNGTMGSGGPGSGWNGTMGSGGPGMRWNGTMGWGGPGMRWNGTMGSGGPGMRWNGTMGSGGPGMRWNGTMGSGGPGWRGSQGSGGSGGSGSAGYQDHNDDGDDDDNDDDDDDPLAMMSMSTVQDFKSGLVYVLDKMKMSCTAYQMPQKTLKMGMNHGTNLLHISRRQNSKQGMTGFKYQGQTYLRRMLVDVWAVEDEGVTQELYFLAERDRSMWRDHYEQRRRQQQQQQQQQQSPQGAGSGSSYPSSGPRATSSKPKPAINMAPYPVLVGMYTKNFTADKDASMVEIFRDVFRSRAMEWMKARANSSSSTWTWRRQSTTPSSVDTPSSGRRSRSGGSMGWRRGMGDQMVFGMQMMRLLEQRLPHKLVHVYNYQPLHSDSTNFQVSLCYPNEEISNVMVVIEARYDVDVMQNFAVFSNNMRQALAKGAGVSLLQISNLMPMPMGSTSSNLTSVTFSLLGWPNVRPRPKFMQPTSGSGPPPQNQADLANAKEQLKAALGNNIVFTVEYTRYSKSFIIKWDHVLMDFDKKLGASMADGTPWPAAGAGMGGGGKRRAGAGLAGTPGASGSALGTEEDGSGGGSSGYSGEAMAGVAIATLVVGAAGALGGAYLFYNRRRTKGDSGIPYQMES